MEYGPARRPAIPVVSVFAAGAAAITLAVIVVPWLRSSFEAPSLRVALETGGSLLAAAAAVLVLRRAAAIGARAGELWLAAGLCLLVVTALVVSGLSIAGAWAPDRSRYALGGTLAATVMLAITALPLPAPRERARGDRRSTLIAVAALGTGLFALAALLAGSEPRGLAAVASSSPAYHAGAGRVLVHFAIAAALLIAAVGLARRAASEREPLLRWIAAALVLTGFARLDAVIFPAADVHSVRLADLLSLLAWIVLFAAAADDLRRRAAARSRAAVERERRRLARDLHDGVAQELAFIRRRAGQLGELPGGAEILSAAERALEDSRRAIAALAPVADAPLAAALQRHAERLSLECGVQVDVTTRCAPDIDPAVRGELLRIVAEAVRNAAQHGGARHVRVDLFGAPLRVRVIDDGRGFVDGANSGRGVAGHGLTAMRERAEQVGGRLSLESVPGAGTLVQVVLP